MSVAELIPAGVTTPPPRKPPTARPDPYADPPQDGLFEVVQGVAVEKPMGLYEQYIAGLLYGRLLGHCDSHPIGRPAVEVKFAIPGSGNDRQPDVAFVSFKAWPAARGIPKVNAWPVAPDLAVEVVSPSDKLFDVFDKVHEYFRGGVQQVWLVLSNVEQVHLYSSPSAVRILTRADDLTGDPLLPGFRLPLAELFPAADPTPATP